MREGGGGGRVWGTYFHVVARMKELADNKTYRKHTYIHTYIHT